MNLVISGMALSLQQIPSTSYYTENLVIERDNSPLMVEHPGEVILQATRSVPPGKQSGLLILHTATAPEYGFYITHLEERFGDVKLGKPSTFALIDILSQVRDLFREDPDLTIVISETTSTGTAAISLSTQKQNTDSLASIVFPDQRGIKTNFELAGFAGDLDEAGLKKLGNLIQKRTGGRRVSLSQPGSYRQPKESLFSLIHLVLAIKAKLLPAWIPPEDLIPLIENIPGLAHNGHSLPWLATGQEFNRSAVLIGSSHKLEAWQSLEIIDIRTPIHLHKIQHINGVDPYLFIICGENQLDLVDKLEQLEIELSQRISLSDLAQNAYAQYAARSHQYTCCLLAANREALDHEIQHAKTGLPAAFSSQSIWTSPAGSYFTPQPFGGQEIAFVYPGAFNSYPGMGQGLFFSFPGLQDAALEIIPDLSQSLAYDIIYPTGLAEPASEEFYNNPGKIIESGISISSIYTLILERIFDVKPAAAFGYSLGEISMLWANHVWQNATESSKSWKESTIFTEQISGKMLVVREAWDDHDLPQDFWGSYMLKANADQVRSACEKEDRVSLTIQNTADEVVISGEKNACLRIIEDLSCHALPMPLNTALHHPAVKSSQESFISLFRNPVTPRDDIRFYSAATDNQLSLNQSELTHSMAEMICSPFDFPKLVNRVYQDGTRIFIEAGPQKTCTRWISKILKGKPHVVIPLNKRYQPDLHGILKVLALLLSHGTELDLTALFTISEEKSAIQERWVDSSTSQDEVHSYSRSEPALVHKLTENLDRISADMAASHKEFLTQQAVLTRNLTRVLELQAGAAPNGSGPITRNGVLYTRDQIQAFTNGDHRICFGNQFVAFENRRFPRLPNGPLQLIDRVIQIDGLAGEIHSGSSLISEVDLPEGAWYSKVNSFELPHVAIMEIALQPCGFLSAFMGSIQGRENQDLYFRNLDGEAKLLFWPHRSIQMITNKVQLLSSSVLEDVIIQKYGFELFQDGEPFFQGNSSFGYFPLTMLENQPGLDGNQPSETWKEENPQMGNWQRIPAIPMSEIDRQIPHLPELEELWIAPRGGIHNQGYIYLEQDIPENSWFYKAHFYQDPVMPGSLGVETMARSLMATAPNWNIPTNLAWRFKSGSNISWKYRGQITPNTPNIRVELHIKNIFRGPDGWQICADGHLWKNDTKIYQIDNICLESQASRGD